MQLFRVAHMRLKSPVAPGCQTVRMLTRVYKIAGGTLISQRIAMRPTAFACKRTVEQINKKNGPLASGVSASYRDFHSAPCGSAEGLNHTRNQ
jgi:type IV secretory pathway VirB4 component